MMPDSSKAIGAALRRLRKGAGMSQEELADRAAVHRTFVSQIERGLRNPTLEVIGRLADALGMSASSLVAEAEREAANA